MRFEGNPEVLRNLWRKKQLIESGDVSQYEYRTLILVLGGVMRGVYAGGQCIALEEAGLTKAFDIAVGISTGAAMLGFFLSGKLRENIDIYWSERREFIDFSRLWKGGRPIADTNHLFSVFRRRMDQEAIVRSRTTFHVGVTCVETGRGVLLDAKTVAPDVVEALHASCAMPAVCERTVALDGVEYLDGASALSFPARRVVEEYEPTDLLVLANCPSDERGSMFKDLLMQLLVRDYPEPFQRTFAMRNRRFAQEAAWLRSQRSLRWGIVWSGTKVRRFEDNLERLEDETEEARLYMSHLLGRERCNLDFEGRQSLAAE